jgi:hypothetical protein
MQRIFLVVIFFLLVGCSRFDKYEYQYKSPIYQIEYDAPKWAYDRNIGDQIDLVYKTYLDELYHFEFEFITRVKPTIMIIETETGGLPCACSATGWVGGTYSSSSKLIRISNKQEADSVLEVLSHEMHHFFSDFLYGNADANHEDLFPDVSAARDYAYEAWDNAFAIPR